MRLSRHCAIRCSTEADPNGDMNDFARALIFASWLFGTMYLSIINPHDPGFIWIGSIVLAVAVRVVTRKVDESAAKKKLLGQSYSDT
jgi:hypothetical protein